MLKMNRGPPQPLLEELPVGELARRQVLKTSLQRPRTPRGDVEGTDLVKALSYSFLLVSLGSDVVIFTNFACFMFPTKASAASCASSSTFLAVAMFFSCDACTS